MITWLETVMAGTDVSVEEWIAEWRRLPAGCSGHLHEYLGITWVEMLIYVLHRAYWPDVVEARRAGRPVQDVIMKIAAGEGT